MEEYGFWEIEKRVIRTKDTAQMTDVFNVILASFFATALFYEPSESLRDQFMWVLEESVASSSLTEWMGLWFKGAANLIYGEPVFETGQPPFKSEQEEG